MSQPESNQRGTRGPRWVNRVLIGIGVVVSLALVGENTALSSVRWGYAKAHELEGRTSQLALALNGVVTAYHTVRGWSDATIEMLSLVLVGFTLIGTARWLDRRHRREQAQADRTKDTREAVLAVLRPQSHAESTTRRAAR